jgi:dTMP kinase
VTRTARRGRLVALEGIDGAGKSTVARRLSQRLRAQGWSVGRWREPVDRELGRLAQSAGASDPWTGAIYFTLDRHLARPRLERALRRFEVVVTDRSFFSTLAYQGSALPPRSRRRLEALQRVATVAPDRVVWIDLAPTEALRRLGRRRSVRGPLERRRVLTRVAREYQAFARNRGWITVDGRQPVRAIVDEIVRSLRLGRSRGRSSRRRRERT